MPVAAEKNIYGLPEGVFKACLYLGLTFPPTVEKETSQEKAPSDYFGDDFELNEAMRERLRAERKWTKENFDKKYANFSKVFAAQKLLKQTKTDLNVYFCDCVLFASKQNGTGTDDYFDFAFYKKSRELQGSFITRLIATKPQGFATNALTWNRRTIKPRRINFCLFSSQRLA